MVARSEKDAHGAVAGMVAVTPGITPPVAYTSTNWQLLLPPGFTVPVRALKITGLAGVVAEGATQGRPEVMPPTRISVGQLVESNVGAPVTLSVMGTTTLPPPVAVAVNVTVPVKVVGVVMPKIGRASCRERV